MSSLILYYLLSLLLVLEYHFKMNADIIIQMLWQNLHIIKMNERNDLELKQIWHHTKLVYICIFERRYSLAMFQVILLKPSLQLFVNVKSTILQSLKDHKWQAKQGLSKKRGTSKSFVQSSWNLVKIIISWANHFHQVSWGSDKKCGFLTNGQFLGVGPFFWPRL